MSTRGTYYQPTPLDFAILAKLPDVGLIGGIRYEGRLAKHVRQDLNEQLPPDVPRLSVGEVQARLRAMHVAGFCKPFAGGPGGSHIWARTPEGAEHLTRREEVLGL